MTDPLSFHRANYDSLEPRADAKSQERMHHMKVALAVALVADQSPEIISDILQHQADFEGFKPHPCYTWQSEKMVQWLFEACSFKIKDLYRSFLTTTLLLLGD